MDKKMAKIYEENAKYVYNVALGMLRDKHDAEDVTQNVFIKLFDSLSSFRGDSDIKTYLYRMTVNRCIDLIRSKKVRTDKMDKVPQKETKNEETGFLLGYLLEQIDLDHRAPVLLSEIGGFSYKEISEILNINVGTVKSRINRAINKMKVIAMKEGVRHEM